MVEAELAETKVENELLKGSAMLLELKREKEWVSDE